jgi:hypothetical protein
VTAATEGPDTPDAGPGDVHAAAGPDTDVDGDGADPGDRIALRASASKWVWVLIGSLVFATFGGGLIVGERTGGVAKGIGWILVVMFGFCAFTALRQVVAPGSLLVSRSSIDVVSQRRHTSFAVADCGPFMVWRNPSHGSTMVVFDYAADGDTELAVQNRQLMGGSRSLPGNYGVSAQDLADLLNDVRGANRRIAGIDPQPGGDLERG